MKKSNNKRIQSNITIITILLTIIVTISISCSGIYDNIEKYAGREIIYADKLDGIIRVQIGYERVEIDLMNAGRIPSSRVRTSKATRTVIECADFTEPDNRRVIDSVCSWVNVTGLTQSKNYHLTIYTEDNLGNRSLPLTIEVQPFTSENLDALALVAPSIIESTSAALVEWKDRISAKTHTVYRYSWQYTDKDGTVHTGKDEGDMPSFFVENVEKGKDIPITLTCVTIPTIMNFEGAYTPILDAIDWQSTVVLRISESAEAAIFLKTPTPVIDINMNNAETDFPILFSWITVSEATGYALKISSDPAFPSEATKSIDVGDLDKYLMDITEGLAIINSFSSARQTILYWTVMPTTQNAPVINQVRRINALRTPALVGKWLFDNGANLVEAETGLDLVPVGNGFTPIDGPTHSNKAVRVAKGSHYKALHGLPDGTDRYTIRLNVKFPVPATHTLVQTSVTNDDAAELILNELGLPGFDGIGVAEVN